MGMGMGRNKIKRAQTSNRLPGRGGGGADPFLKKRYLK